MKLDNNENTKAERIIMREEFAMTGMTGVRRKDQPIVYIKEQSSPIK